MENKTARPAARLLVSVAVGIAAALLVLLAVVWLPNAGLIRNTVFSESIRWADKSRILWTSLGAFRTAFSVGTQAMALAIAALFGIQSGMLVAYVGTRIRMERSVGTGVAGIVSGMLGIGCAACGSVIFSSLFGAGSTAAFLGILPFRGTEFGILGIIFLGTSIIGLAKKMKRPAACRINITPPRL